MSTSTGMEELGVRGCGVIPASWLFKIEKESKEGEGEKSRGRVGGHRKTASPGMLQEVHRRPECRGLDSTVLAKLKDGFVSKMKREPSKNFGLPLYPLHLSALLISGNSIL